MADMGSFSLNYRAFGNQLQPKNSKEIKSKNIADGLNEQELKKLDKNNDGSLSQDEFAGAFKNTDEKKVNAYWQQFCEYYNPTKKENADGTYTVITKTEDGKKVYTTYDKDNQMTGYVIQENKANNEKTRTYYNAAGEEEYTIYYDKNGKKESKIYPASEDGTVKVVQYNKKGNISSCYTKKEAKDENGNTTTTRTFYEKIDENGALQNKLETIETGKDTKTTTKYNKEGNIESIKIETKQEDKVKIEFQNSNNEVTTSYTKTTDENGNTIRTYTMNDGEKVNYTSSTSADENTIKYYRGDSVDESKLLKTKISEDKKTTTTEYSKEGNKTKETISEGNSATITTFDKTGKAEKSYTKTTQNGITIRTHYEVKDGAVTQDIKYTSTTTTNGDVITSVKNDDETYKYTIKNSKGEIIEYKHPDEQKEDDKNTYLVTNFNTYTFNESGELTSIRFDANKGYYNYDIKTDEVTRQYPEKDSYKLEYKEGAWMIPGHHFNPKESSKVPNWLAQFEK